MSDPLTIHHLLELPRPTAPIPNPSGTLALWPSSTYKFAESKTEKIISLVFIPAESAENAGDDPKVKPLEETPCVVLSGLDSNEAVWLDDETFLFIRTGKADPDAQSSTNEISSAELWAKDAIEGDEYLVGKLPVKPANLKVKHTATGKVWIAFSAVVYPDGDPYAFDANAAKEKADAKGSDAKVYDSLFVRHWDTWTASGGKKEQIHLVELSKSLDVDGFEKIQWPDTPSRWTFADSLRPHIISPLKGTELESPVAPFGGTDDFDISDNALIFHAKDPLVNPAWHTRTQVYYVPIVPTANDKPKPLTSGKQGACSSPIFSTSGTRIAWLEQNKDGYEADKNTIVIFEMESRKRWKLGEAWDRSVGNIRWDGDNVIWATVEDRGYGRLFKIDVPSEQKAKAQPWQDPKSSTEFGSVTSVNVLEDRLLLAINSFTSPNQLYTLKSSQAENAKKEEEKLLASLTPTLHETTYLSKGEEFWFPGAKTEVHGFILFPMSYKEKEKATKKFPLAFLVHGGPESAWTDSWSTRWNPNIYASAGYITVVINPTGSTGYGQEFTDAIHGQWGGLPFQDLVAGLNFVKSTWPAIDPERMAMLGASYGGYMANWIQGHNDQMGFKCLVCHDGVFSTSETWFSTEELYFPEHEFGGTPYEVPENYARWNPQNHINHWRTPQLVIHNTKDYRLTESHGLGVFNTLQRLGIPSRYVVFPSENHWVLSPPNSARWHEEVLRWINEWCGKK